MKRIRNSIAVSLAVAAAMHATAAGAAVDGGMIDADVPATYRLPAIEAPAAPTANVATQLFSPPMTTTVKTPFSMTNQTQSVSSPQPAGAPPDERVGEETVGTAPVVVSVPQVSATAEVVTESTPAPGAPAVVSVEMEPTTPPPANNELTTQLLPGVQRGTGLAQRGAFFAARTEFVQVLRRLAQARDEAANSDDHSRALAAGLRALDEAEDFIPSGTQLEAEMDMRAVASSHRTPVLPNDAENVTPFEAVAMYHAFAEAQLGKAAAGERAGSMALYGLGRVHSQLAEQADEDVQHTRAATTMYAAALKACPDNHLAANELGVLVCRAGRPQEATELFERAIDVAPSATAYHNLAMAQQRIGLHTNAVANEQESQRIAAFERSRGDLSRRAGVRWVTPDQLASSGQLSPWTAAVANRQPVGQPRVSQAAPAVQQRRWR